MKKEGIIMNRIRIGTRRVTLFVVALLALVLVASPRLAFAQTGPVVGPLTNLSATTLVVAGLGFLLAILTNMVSSGNLLGLVVTPQAWLPYLTLGVTFLAAFVPALTSAEPLTALSWANAALSGLTALIAYGAGHAVHAHVQTAQRAARIAAMATRVTLAAALVLGIGAGVIACGTNGPAWARAFSDVITDIQSHETLEQIEINVAADLGFAGVVNTVVSTFVVDAIDEAIALGLIPPAYVPTATDMEKVEASRLIQMGGHLPTSMLLRHHRSESALLVGWNVAVAR
jgi:hypothetical protein